MAGRRKEPKGEPFSIRLTGPTERFVVDEARRIGRSKSSVVEMLTEEAARMRRFPGIGFRGTDAQRRAWVIGTGLDVWQIVEALEEAGSAEKLVETTELGPREVQLAAAYRDHYPQEIEEAIADNRRPIRELEELYPFLEAQRLE